MKKVFLTVLFLSVIQLACGQIYLDYSVVTQYVGEPDPYEVHLVERFTLAASTPVHDFFIGITQPLPYNPPQEVCLWDDITIYPVNMQILWTELDVHLPTWMPTVNVLQPNTFAEYMGADYNNMNIWWVCTNNSMGVTGPIVEFVYIPEPASLLLLGLGGLMLRCKK